MKEFAQWFDITVAISGTRAYHCFKPLNSRAITTADTSLSTSFRTHQIKNLKSNSTDILVSEMIMISSYVACEYDGHWWLGIVQESWDHMFYIKFIQSHGPHSNLFWSQRDDYCWIEDCNVLLVIHTPSTETGQTYKMLPELLFQIVKKHRSRCSHRWDINHTHECTWNGTYICFR
jgi:hypothetical protein